MPVHIEEIQQLLTNSMPQGLLALYKKDKTRKRLQSLLTKKTLLQFYFTTYWSKHYTASTCNIQKSNYPKKHK